MKLELTQAAIEDLSLIRAYTLEKWGAEQEQAYLDAVWEKFTELQSNPSLGRERSDFFPGCSIVVQDKHMIFFRRQAEVLQIVRVLHGSMDFPRHL